MALLDQLGTFLAAQGCGTVGTDLFLGRMPETGSTVLGLLEYGGEPSIQTFRRPVLQTVRLQVCCRSNGYAIARARVARIWTLLDGYRGDAMAGVYWIEALQPPFRIGSDENQRELVGFNLRCHLSHPAPEAISGSGEAVSVGLVDDGVVTLPA